MMCQKTFKIKTGKLERLSPKLTLNHCFRVKNVLETEQPERVDNKMYSSVQINLNIFCFHVFFVGSTDVFFP